LFVSQLSIAQKEAYKIYNAKGKAVEFEAIVKQAQKADVILFGEFHDNPIIHWLQLELLQDLYDEGSNLVLGAEMMEADDQLIINEYLAGYYNSQKLISESKSWPNFKTDYLPLLDFAKTNHFNFIATNIPRRYATMVYNYGLDTLTHLSELAKSYIAPLPISIDTTLISYQEMLMMGKGHGGDHLVKSQAIKDATMAHFIVQNLKRKHQFIHFNGAFHSKNYEGIYWYLKKLKPRLEILTISCEEQKDLSRIADFSHEADFMIITPSNMTKTH
jgi:uncharacterized iron-regulated protein